MGPRTSVASLPIQVAVSDHEEHNKAMEQMRKFQVTTGLCARDGVWGEPNKFKEKCSNVIGDAYSAVNDWASDTIVCDLKADTAVVEDKIYKIYQSVCSGQNKSSSKAIPRSGGRF